MGDRFSKRQALVHPPHLFEPQLLSQFLFGVAPVQHFLESLGLFQGGEVLALDVLHQGHFGNLVIIGLDHAHRGGVKPGYLASPPPTLTGHQHKLLGDGGTRAVRYEGAESPHHHQRLDESLLLDGLRQLLQFGLIKNLARLEGIRVYKR